MPELFIELVATLVFALVPILPKSLSVAAVAPRSLWLSLAGGISVAYVFVHLLPELAGHQANFSDHVAPHGPLAAIERHIYLIALAGLVTFYGLDHLVRTSALRLNGRPSLHLFFVHLGVFALYASLIGYLLVRRTGDGPSGTAVYVLALAPHLFVIDQGLRTHHGAVYDAVGRWIMAAAPAVGWALGHTAPISSLATSALFAALAGGIVLNVLKEELPPERDSRFSAFLGGASGYSAILLLGG